MQTPQYNPSQVVQEWNGIEVYTIDGKYGLHNPENDIIVPPIYDSIEWDKSSDFIVCHSLSLLRLILIQP